jgi:hypothetical protein
MRRAVWTISASAILATTLCLAAGCKQGEGDSCQLDSDCEGDLICCVQPGTLKKGGHGQCLPKSKCDQETDGGVDAGEDAGGDGPAVDAEQPDAKQPDAKQPDAKQPDAKQPDAKVTPDAATPDTATSVDAASVG